MTHPIVTTLLLAPAVANGIALSQTPGSAGNLTVNGSLVTAGVATFDVPRRVIITSAADDTARTFTIYGTARSEQGGIAIVENLQGANGIAQSTQDFATVTRIAVDAATAGAVTAGTDGTGSGPWVPWDTTNNVTFQIRVSGNVTAGVPTWQVDYTYDDVYGLWLPSNVPFPRAIALPNLTGKTGAADDVIPGPVKASRLTITAVGGVQLTQTQVGN